MEQFLGQIQAHGESEFGPVVVVQNNDDLKIYRIDNDNENTECKADIGDKLYAETDDVIIDAQINGQSVFNQKEMYVVFKLLHILYV